MRDLLIDQLKNMKVYKELLEDIDKKASPIALYGIQDENIAHILYALKKHQDKPVFIITYDTAKARALRTRLNDLKKEGSSELRYKELIYYDIVATSREIVYDRVKFLNDLIEGENKIYIASIDSLMMPVLKKRRFEESIYDVEIGSEIDLKSFTNHLNLLHYERVERVEQCGQYSIRGGIVDVYSPQYDDPLRIELFDTEVDSLRFFDSRDQRTLQNVSKAKIIQAGEIILYPEEKLKIAQKVRRDLEKINAELDDELYKERINKKFMNIIERLEQNIALPNPDILLPYIGNYLESAFSYIIENSMVILDESSRVKQRYEDKRESYSQKFTEWYQQGEIMKSHTKIFKTYKKFIEGLQIYSIITMSMLSKSDDLFRPQKIHTIVSKEIVFYNHKMDLLINDLKKWQIRGYKVIIAAGNVQKAERIDELLNENKVAHRRVNEISESIQSSEIVIVPIGIERGVEYPEIKFVLVSDREIYGIHKTKKKRKSRDKNRKKIDTFTDLKVGDFVVHESHGIGRYMGIEKLDIQGIIKDYMEIQYSGEDKLFVPVDQMDLIQKYIGGDSLKPRVNRLNSTEWQKTKTRAKKAIEDMADELIELYAKRKAARGYQFSADTNWQKEFEDLFPYEETDDQLRCIEEIKGDMENQKVMDRLLCGDVGYGKTEVALRAAFKAAIDSKQVAILVPTTILAQQHYNTISERFRDYPVKVQMLSRFRTKGQQREIMNGVKNGEVDIVVGTHRILSDELKFKDLGLLIIDEEQRFGVKHKEKIKQFKANIDVLTLTATPIPRTLHMSMIGVRDMSVIEEPPEERIPVQSYVLEFNENVIRDSILKEIDRDGQVFYVYNRVQGIDEIAKKIQEIVPEARVGIGHGQMGERELENVMIDFMNYEYDVLVATTIIETGLDVSRANTMIIHDADKMGLSQLYQLRGRVGRSNRIAYAYFMYERNKSLTEIAEKRLKAIKEFTEFGSGFKIAMRDLELRGAGNLLGSQQSGHMESIGYELYVKYLEEAVKKLQGIDVRDDIETEVDFNVDAYIPKKYIDDEILRVETYKKIAMISDQESYEDMLDELIDRFGEYPRAVSNLLKIAKIKGMSNKMGIVKLQQLEPYLIIHFKSGEALTSEVVNELVMCYRNKIAFDASSEPKLKFRLKASTQKEILAGVEEIVNKLSVLIE
jgi:transcription-repair coupling factor (superfamily II helicase)